MMRATCVCVIIHTVPGKSGNAARMWYSACTICMTIIVVLLHRYHR